MLAMKALIHLSRLLRMLALLTWGLTLSLVVTLVSKVPHLMHLLLHLLQGNQDLAWQKRLQLVSLVIQTSIWLVVLTLFITQVCLISLTHPCTLGQDLIRLLLMTMVHLMITRSQGLRLRRTPISSLFDDC
jgi:hypothetical protein